ncbi:Mor transcription activator family protein [Marinobacter sp. CA1]|uniref:Mor transcription activator family protein n=1 Tax=Marinobacter sp. CA1 TaxID=2817656 RepID=UPI001D06703B|nr:Mor transcription activator family protein [Marinobacter sp. CA1]UDL03989.1 hypothetical protein J2887_14870 [Marinobacter sp. CA1]
MITTLNRDLDTAVELHRILTASLARRFKMTEVAAAVLADEIAVEIRNEVGGSELYIPGPSRTARNRLICEQFTGDNHEQLAKQFRLSRRQVERIVSNRDIRPLKMSVAG